jgi:hypothetical protein
VAGATGLLPQKSFVNIIILAFVIRFFSPGEWLTLNLGPLCSSPTVAQLQAGADGLLDCTSNSFDIQIEQCQENGKKVLLSLGGCNSGSAKELAQTIWWILSSRIAKFGEPPASSPLRFSTSASTTGSEETSDWTTLEDITCNSRQARKSTFKSGMRIAIETRLFHCLFHTSSPTSMTMPSIQILR